MKKILRICTVFCLLGAFFSTNVFASAPSPAAQGAVLMDGETGRVLWGKAENEPLAMASTTKIMTAILVIEANCLDDIVTVSARAASAPKVKMNLSVGETLRAEDLLYAMMMKSYNDTAVALAEHISGSVEAFTQKMTERAHELGATDTVFATPNGLDAQFTLAEHHSTAYDMALIAKHALTLPKLTEVLQTPSITLPIQPGTGKSYAITNANRLLHSYPGAIGMKTGYTNKAGHCFVGAARREDVTLITTVLASGWGGTGKEQKWRDTQALLDYGFANYKKHVLINQNAPAGSISIRRSPVASVTAICSESFDYLLSEEEKARIQITDTLPDTILAPVAEGDVLGTRTVSLDNTTLGTIPLLAAHPAPRYTLKDRMHQLLERWTDMSYDILR